MLEGLCESTAAIPPTAPATPADFFNLVGMAEWRDIDSRSRGKEAVSWA